ncbi:MAG: hypothetical protein SV775_09880 [Thermodesulfobacteriota bacterium]|nr:hypothetical protein [Thermodesulfobacteriota bacterium]
MIARGGERPVCTSAELIYCAECKNFSYFYNKKDHNSPHALGKCQAETWDGNRGQWAMFQHQCKNFVKPDR